MTPYALPPTLPTRFPRPVLVLLALLVAAAGMLAPATGPTQAAAAQNDRLGIDHISYGNGVFSADRYKWAKEAGAGWNRWVLYWNDIEKSAGNFDYSRTDAAVNADTANGFKVLGILMGTPD